MGVDLLGIGLLLTFGALGRFGVSMIVARKREIFQLPAAERTTSIFVGIGLTGASLVLICVILSAVPTKVPGF